MSGNSIAVVMATRQLAAAFEARGSSNHSSPTNLVRDVPLHGTAEKEVKKYVLVSVCLDERGNEGKSETDVVPDQMSYLGDRPDESSLDIRL